MTTLSCDRDQTIANVILKGTGDERLFVSAKFNQCRDGWIVDIAPGSEERFGNKRKRLAIARICELDAAIKLTLQTGHTVQRTVPTLPSPTDEQHTAMEQILPLLLPLNIKDNLYPYQRHGVAWLLRHKRALLGDDMGLGKTAQALSAGRRLIRFGHVSWILVVSPRTLIANWMAEAAHWAPELTTATALPLGELRSERWSRLVRRAHLLFTSYEQLRNPAEALLRNPPDLIIADEAHRLRNIDSLSTQGFRAIHSEWFWALTGTPIERDAEDLAVLLSLLDSSRFSPADKSLPPISLRARLRPYLLRRRKDSVLEELPNVVEDNEMLDLTDGQQKAYRIAISDHTNPATSGGILPLFNKLRTICDVDPKTGQSCKLDRICELISDIRLAEEKVVVFSYILDPLYRLARRLNQLNGASHFVFITGEMSLQERNQALSKFKSDPICYVLLASTRVASEGLSLTEANHVIFVNRWWNPSSNLQARDRVVRIGQSRLVRVKSFTCRGTVEERLEHLLKEKSMTFDQLIEALSTSANGIDARDWIV